MKEASTFHQKLVARIEKHCAAVGMSVSEFGKVAAKDEALVSRLRAGKDIRLAKYLSIEALLSDGPMASCLSPQREQSVDKNQGGAGQDFQTGGAAG